MKNSIRVLAGLFVLLVLNAGCRSGGSDEAGIDRASIQSALLEKYGDAAGERIRRGVGRAASLWRPEDGTEEDFRSFCLGNFISDPEALQAATATIEENFQVIRGPLQQIERELNAPLILAGRNPTPLDELFARSTPKSDFYGSRLAFFIALNYPRYTLEELLSRGPSWTREEWARARIGELFEVRIPEKIAKRQAEIDRDRRLYFNRYLINMGHVLTPEMKALFPLNFRLNCHHGLRDDIKGQFTKEGGLERQRLIYRVIGRIVDQSIPEAVIGGAEYDWDPASNRLLKSEGGEFVPVPFEPEGNKRYAQLRAAFRLQREMDPLTPETPTFIQRTFEDRQMTDQDVEKLMLSVLESPEVGMVAGLIRKRLGRALEPFDIWYSGFQAQGDRPEDELDRILKARYPDPAAFQADLPRIFRRLGFPADRGDFLASRIVVNPVPTGGFSSGAAAPGGKAHLHTVFQKDGLDYKGYRIAMHEVGHTVHQILSMEGMDHPFLSNVPMSGFAEAIAEIFAYRNMEALGLEEGHRTGAEARDIQALAGFWYLYEMAGQALTELRIWHWMYNHPEASADELKTAVLDIAAGTWNLYFAPYFGDRDSGVLSVYSHLISGSLYLHSYFLGNVIMFQLYDYLQGRDFASEIERMCRQGRLTPDLWMRGAVGGPISTEPLLKAVSDAVDRFGGR